MGPEEPIYGYLTVCSEVKNVTESKHVHTHQHIRMFIHRYMVLKVHLNISQTTDTTDYRKKKKLAKLKGTEYEGRVLLTVENLKNSISL